jgi:hypothetical protein
MQESLVMMARIHLAAGATSVYVLRNPPLEVKQGDTFDEIRQIDFRSPQPPIPWRPKDLRPIEP